MSKLERLNFLLIITDQHRKDHLSCYGNRVLQTPNIDAIAERGARFDQFYVTSPVCMPNRASLMTGRMPSVNGARTNGVPLTLQANTFVEEMRQAGYRTALIGKSHLQNLAPIPVPADNFPNPESNEAFLSEFTGPEYEMELANFWAENPDKELALPYYGFAHVDLCNGHGDRMSGHYLNWAAAKEPSFKDLIGPANALSYDGFDFDEAWRTAVPEELYSTTFIEEHTVNYLEKHDPAGEPFFIQCSFPDPHHPFTPPGKYWDLYDPADCEIPVSAFANFNNPPPLAKKLRRESTRESRAAYPYAAYGVSGEQEIRETIALTYGMIAMVDDAVGKILATLKAQGLDKNTVVMFTSDHGDLMGDHGLMLKHCFHNQGLINVPFIWADPNNVAQSETDQLASTMDIGSTVLARAGLSPFNGMQGVDLFADEPVNRTGLVIEEDEIDYNGNCGKYTRTRTFVTGRWRMTLWLEDNFGELYDRDNDPHEINNLWHDPSAAEDKAELLELMLMERLKLDELSPRPKFAA